MGSLTAPGARGGLAGDSPETRRSTSDTRSEVLRRVSGEATAGLRRDCRPVSRSGPGGWRRVRGQRLAFWGTVNTEHRTSNIQHRTLNVEPRNLSPRTAVQTTKGKQKV
jgi:hypothetical protein